MLFEGLLAEAYRICHKFSLNSRLIFQIFPVEKGQQLDTILSPTDKSKVKQW